MPQNQKDAQGLSKWGNTLKRCSDRVGTANSSKQTSMVEYYLLYGLLHCLWERPCCCLHLVNAVSVNNSQVFLEFVKTVHLVHALKEIWVPSLCILCIVIRCKCWCKYFKSSVFVIFIMTRESRTIFVALSSPDDQVLWVTWQWPNGFNWVSKKVKFRSAKDAKRWFWDID